MKKHRISRLFLLLLVFIVLLPTTKQASNSKQEIKAENDNMKIIELPNGKIIELDCTNPTTANFVRRALENDCEFEQFNNRLYITLDDECYIMQIKE